MICVTGKLGYGTEGEARRAASGHARHKGKPNRMGAYRCPECEQWHLTQRAKHSAKRYRRNRR